MNGWRVKSKILRVRIILILLLILSGFVQVLPEFLNSPAARSSHDSPEKYLEVARKISEVGLLEEKAFEILKRILAAGPRLTGSPQADQAVSICIQMMKEFKFEKVHLEAVEVNRWVRGREEASLLNEKGSKARSLRIAALGGSVGTPEKGIKAPVVEVRSLEELQKAGESLKNSIVLLNGKMDRRILEPFTAYGQAANLRVRGASEAARFGARAVLVRSLTFRIDAYPHTGMLIYDEDMPKIPAAAIATEDAEYISEQLRQGKNLSVWMYLGCDNKGPKMSANVIGELTGSEIPEEVVLVSGHLDSWDLSPGAHDDGAGCAVSIEALRLIKTTGLKPKRTIRAVMFMDEEFGGTGGRFYANDPLRQGEKHIFVVESDRGGYLPLGLALGGSQPEFAEKMKLYSNIFKPLGIHFIIPGGGGTDIAPLVAQGSLPGSVITNSQPYFDVHHSALDVLEKVQPRELELQAIILAILLYIVAEEGV